MKKKIVSLALTATMAVSCMAPLLAACDNGGGDYDHTIVFYSSQGDSLAQITKNAIDSFEAKYPGWKVEHQTPGGYDEVKEKVLSDLQGGNQPDVAYCYADHVAQYLPTEQVIDMNKFIYSEETLVVNDPETGDQLGEYAIGYTEEEIADFVTGYYEEGKATNYSGYDNYGFSADSMLTLPFVKSTELLFYNATVLDKLHLEVPKTWDYLWEVCAPAIKKEYPNATVLGYDSEANWFITMCEQNGWGYTSASGNNYLFNQENDKLRDWLTSLNGYYMNNWLTTQLDYKSYTSALFIKGVENNAGGCVFCIGSSGGAQNQKPTGDAFKAGVAAIPGSVVGKDSEGKDIINNSVISQGPSLVMFNAGHGVSNADEKAKMTFLFIKELLDPTFQAAFSIQAGYNPCRESVYEIQKYKEHLAKADTEDNMTAKACVVAKDLSDSFFTSPAFNGSSTARTQVGNVLYYVMRGEKSADAALNDAYRNCGGR